MRLSDAIALGRLIVTPNDGSFTLFGCKACAVGMALAAMGETTGDAQSMTKYWPWANTHVWFEISVKYFGVVAGEITLDELIDYVRSIEPPELTDTKEEPWETQQPVPGVVES